MRLFAIHVRIARIVSVCALALLFTTRTLPLRAQSGRIQIGLGSNKTAHSSAKLAPSVQPPPATPLTAPPPVTGPAIYLFGFSPSGGGEVAVSLLHDNGTGVVKIDGLGNGYVTADTSGNYNVSGLYASYCPTATSPIYLFAKGGSTGYGTNTDFAEISAFPVACSQLPNVSQIEVGEQTTLAAAYAFAHLSITSADDVLSAPGYTEAQLASLFAYANDLVSGLTDESNATLPTGQSIPLSKIYTLTDILSACTRSSGTTACTNLFAQTKFGNATAPTDTLLSLYNVANNPTLNVNNIYNLFSITAEPYTPVLASAPPDWRITFSAPIATKTTFTLTPAVSTFGSVVGGQVSVSNADSVPATGTISCASGGTLLAPVTPLNFQGTASLSFSSLPVGPTTITCTYSGDSNNATSNASATETVSNSSTTTTVSVFPTTTYVGNPVTVTVNASDSEGLVLSGNVSCSSTGTQHLTFSSSLSNGKATWTTPTLQLGSYAFSCTYSGTTGFSASSSQSVPAMVEAVPQPTWNLTGSMSTGVYLQTATLLPSGNVLIAGGNDNGEGDEGAIAAAEIYTPSTGLFSSTGSMAEARFGHTATLLTSGPNSGDVLIVGGENYAQTVLQEAELYNYQAGSFAVSNAKPSYTRSMHTATQLQDGTILFAGGYKGCVGCGASDLGPAEIYDPVQQAFSTVGSLHTPRTAHTATLLPNGDVLIVGGLDNNNNILQTAELYNPMSKTFIATGNLVYARAYQSATYLPNGQVLIAGGINSSGSPQTDAELYNPATGQFIATGSLTIARATHGSALLYSGNVLLYGGTTDYNGDTTLTAEQYNPSTGKFTATTSLNNARYQAATTLLPNGTILATGGLNYSGGRYSELSSAEIYNLNNSYITGFVNPKYIVLGITYAPPGTSSYVSYANTTTLGTTTMISDSTSDMNGISTSLSETFAIPGLQAIGIGNSVTETGTDSSQYTQTSDSSTTVTFSKSMMQSDKTTGTGDAFNPVNHDYDIVWLWLNPLEIFTINGANPNEILWNGDGFDPNDAPLMDIYPVLVGNLNGDIAMDPSMQKELSRAWANNDQVWPVGQGPGLTTQDYQQIIAGDPFAGCTYNTTANQWSNCAYAASDLNSPLAPPVNSTDGRFSVYSGNQTIPYVQAGPGNGGGLTAGYQDTVTNTTSVANGTSYTQQQSFSLETGFSITANVPLNIFSNAISVKTTYTNTFKTTQTYQKTINTTTIQQDSLSVTGPGCPQTTSPCTPQYQGPPSFVVYQDNLFGSYMFYPLN